MKIGPGVGSFFHDPGPNFAMKFGPTGPNFLEFSMKIGPGGPNFMVANFYMTPGLEGLKHPTISLTP